MQLKIIEHYNNRAKIYKVFIIEAIYSNFNLYLLPFIYIIYIYNLYIQFLLSIISIYIRYIFGILMMYELRFKIFIQAYKIIGIISKN